MRAPTSVEPIEKPGEDIGLGWGFSFTATVLSNLRMPAGTGHAASPRSPVLRVAPGFLVIVARDHAELFPWIRRQFLEDARVQVILDRRRLEGRHKAPTQAPDRRLPDRRRAPDYWEDLRHHPVVLIPAARGVPVGAAVPSSPASATAGGPMDTTDGVTRAHEDIDQLCRRLCQWVGTGRELLGLLVEIRRGLEERDNSWTVDTRAAAR